MILYGYKSEKQLGSHKIHTKYNEMRPRSEAYVAEFGPQQIIELFEIRVILEGLICRLPVPKIETKHVLYLSALMLSVEDEAKQDTSEAYRNADIELHAYLANLTTESNILKLLDSRHSENTYKDLS